MGRATVEERYEAWLRDHPGNPLPEHMCGLTEDEGAEYDRWLEKREPPTGERVMAIKSQIHLSDLKAAWGAADKDARDKLYLETSKGA
jgi:hypothetical protein